MNKFLSFLAGCGAGAVVALLLTPKTGEEVRDAIGDKVREGYDKVREGYDAVSSEIERQGGVRGVVEKGVEKGKNLAEMGRRRVNETIERGRSRINESVEAGSDEYWRQRNRDIAGS
jgi:gas vesicle protein